MDTDRTASKRRYKPSDKALRALQLTYELQIVPTAGYSLLFGSKANRSEQLSRLVAEGLLARLLDPVRRPGPPQHYYALTPAAYPFLRPLPAGQRRPPAVELTPERILAPGTPHLLAAGAFALACLFGLPADLAADWHGEPSARLTLEPDQSGTPGTYVEPDGVLLTTGAHPAACYECDWGSEHEAKWTAKIGRYARAAQQAAHAARYGPAWPPLLVTARTPESLLEIAGYLARHGAAAPALQSWAIWVALYDQVATPELIGTHTWFQVRVSADPAHHPLYDQAWPLVDILTGTRETPAVRVARAQAAAAEQTRQLAAQAAEERRRRDAAQAQADADRRRRELVAWQQQEAQRRAEDEVAALRAEARVQAEQARQAQARRQEVAAVRVAQRWDVVRFLAAGVGGIGGIAVLVGVVVPRWTTFWWGYDPTLPALWADPNGVPVFQAVGTLLHVNFLILIAPFLFSGLGLLAWLTQSTSSPQPNK